MASRVEQLAQVLGQTAKRLGLRHVTMFAQDPDDTKVPGSIKCFATPGSKVAMRDAITENLGITEALDGSETSWPSG